MDPRARDTFLASFGRCRAAAGFLDAAHLAVRAQLTPEQIEQYVTLRGYGHAGHAGH